MTPERSRPAADGTSGGGPATVRAKARDGWWTVLVIDPIAVPLVARAARFRRPSPLQLTFASAVTGVLAGALMARGCGRLGALAYQVSFLLDCIDGKLAKTRNLDTTFGQVADTAADSVRFAACSAGLASGLAARNGRPSDLALFMLHSGVRCGALLTGAARDAERNDTAWIELPPTPVGALRRARSRLGYPGSTVDTELVAFTIAPFLGRVRGGIAFATLADSMHLIALLVDERRRSAAAT